MTESSRGADAPLRRALSLAREALRARPSGLLTDFDGTVSAIVNDPMSARLAPGAAAALRHLATRLAVVAIVTGRAASDARRLAGVPDALVAGNHGVEWLEPGAAEPRADSDARVRNRLVAALAAVPQLPGVVVEDKAISATIHYRGAPDPPAARGAILDAVVSAADDRVEVREGRMSVELRPRGAGDKGTALRAIVDRYDLRGAVVMGDDATDVDMFLAAAELRGAGRLRAAVIGVGGADREVPPEVAAASDVVLRDPEQVAALLRGLSRIA